MLRDALEHVADESATRPSDDVLEAARAGFAISSVQALATTWENSYRANARVKNGTAAQKWVARGIAALWSMAYAVSATYAVAAMSGKLVLPVYHRMNWWFSAGTLLLAITVAAFGRVRRAPIEQVRRQFRMNLERAEDAFVLALRVEAEALTSAVLNERAVLDRAQLAVLDSSLAPSLVELDSTDMVPSASARDVLDFIEEHPTSAIGISGTRGVGKSTLMQFVRSQDPDNYLGVYFPVPVQYSAPDFFRVFFAEVATEVMASYGFQDDEGRVERVRRSRVRLARYLTGNVVALGGVLLIVYARSKNSFPINPIDLPGLALIAAGLVMIVAAIRSRPAAVFRDLGRPGYEIRERRLAEEVLRGLRFASTHQSGSKNTFAVKFLTMEDEEQLELSERDPTHPELVARFKTFVGAYRRSSPREIVVALDELDKMEDPRDALAFVNGIKDLLHIPGVHFLVSVSEDALHNFSLRGVPLRDAFDSSFDVIIPIRRFTVVESRDLLKRRVVDFPDPLVLLCHALSGGIPRDLIRAARQCVLVRRTADAAVPVEEVVRTVLRQKAVTVCEALAAKATESDPALMTAALRGAEELRGTDDRDSLILALDVAAGELRGTGALSALGANAAAYLACVSVLCRYFCAARTNGEWEDELISGRSPAVVEPVARAIELLQFDSDSALAVLARIPANAVTT